MTTLTRWRPFGSFYPAEFDRPIGDLWRRHFGAEAPEQGDWLPTADLIETPEGFVAKLETPGMEPGECKVTLSGDALIITGERRREEQREEDNWHIVERSTGKFRRTFILPSRVDPDSVTARLADGILTVEIAKATGGGHKQVEVQSG